MSESESYYSDDEYSSYDEHDKAQDDDRNEKEPSKPASMMEWILRGGALANSKFPIYLMMLTVVWT